MGRIRCSQLPVLRKKLRHGCRGTLALVVEHNMHRLSAPTRSPASRRFPRRAHFELRHPPSDRATPPGRLARGLTTLDEPSHIVVHPIRAAKPARRSAPPRPRRPTRRAGIHVVSSCYRRRLQRWRHALDRIGHCPWGLWNDARPGLRACPNVRPGGTLRGLRSPRGCASPRPGVTAVPDQEQGSRLAARIRIPGRGCPYAASG